MSRDNSGRGGEVSGERLAGVVWADEVDLVGSGNGGGRAFEQRAALDGIGDVVDAQHGWGWRMGGVASRGLAKFTSNNSLYWESSVV